MRTDVIIVLTFVLTLLIFAQVTGLVEISW